MIFLSHKIFIGISETMYNFNSSLIVRYIKVPMQVSKIISYNYVYNGM